MTTSRRAEASARADCQVESFSEKVIEPEAEAELSETEAPGVAVDGLPSETSEAIEDGRVDSLVKAKVPEQLISPIIPPMPTRDGKDVHMVTVILRPRRDKVRDNLLLRRVFGLMISSPGNDRFAFHIFEKGRGHLLEFPNLTTGLNPELIARLNELVGPENVRVEPITFQ